MMFVTKKEKIKAAWIVFNEGTDLEFAECDNCGHESTKKKDEGYPWICPQCGAETMTIVMAEDVRAQKQEE